MSESDPKSLKHIYRSKDWPWPAECGFLVTDGEANKAAEQVCEECWARKFGERTASRSNDAILAAIEALDTAAYGLRQWKVFGMSDHPPAQYRTNDWIAEVRKARNDLVKWLG